MADTAATSFEERRMWFILILLAAAELMGMSLSYTSRHLPLQGVFRGYRPSWCSIKRYIDNRPWIPVSTSV